MPTPINLTPREDRINRRLLLVGPGPAAFFADACRIMAAPTDLATTTHLMGHLLRELEGGLRAVLGVVVEPATNNTLPAVPAVVPTSAGPAPKDTHLRQVRLLLSGLGIPVTDPVAVFWISMTGYGPMALARWAHRDRLAAPRAVDKDLLQLWEGMQRLLDSVLNRFESRYAAIFSRLDEMLKHPAPTPEDLRALAQNMPWAPVVQHYFFERLAAGAWLAPLHAENLLPSPPPPDFGVDGRMAFSSWAPAPYLQRMASLVPDTVVSVLSGVSTGSVTARAQILEIATSLPAEHSLAFVPRVFEWAAEIEQFAGADRAVALAAHIADGGFTDSAIDIMAALLRPPALATRQSNSPAAGSRDDTAWYSEDEKQEPGVELLPTEPNPWSNLQTPWFLHAANNTVIQRLLDTAPVAWFDRVLSLLDGWIGAMSTRPTPAGGPAIYDWSPWWGADLDGSVEEPAEDLRAWLAIAALAAATVPLGRDPDQLATLVARLRRSPYLIARRLELRVLAHAPQAALEMVRERVADPDWLRSQDLAPEYVALLAIAFPHLRAADRATLVNEIKQGPRVPLSDDTTPEYLTYREAYSAAWRRDRLAVLRSHLPDQDLALLDALVAGSGPPVPVTHTPFETTGGFVGPTSPLSDEVVVSMSPEQVVAYLSEWQPSGDSNAPTAEGLARVLTAQVGERPEVYASDAMRFTALAPTYIRALFEGLREAIRHERAFTWAPVLEAGRWVIGQAIPAVEVGAPSFDLDVDLRPSRRALAALLVQGLYEGPCEIPIHQRGVVWENLRALSQDPSPTPAEESHAGMDPFTFSINTTRPEAIRGVLLYALWVQRRTEAQGGAHGFSLVPEAEAVMCAHLDPAFDPSLAVRAAIGERLPSLIYFDRDWVADQLPLLLPGTVAAEAFRDAAWNAYIIWTQPHPKVLDLLVPAFGYAIERLDNTEVRAPAGGQRPDERLAEHLMNHYWHGRLTLNSPDGLSRALFARANGQLRAHAIQFIGRSLNRGRQDSGRADAQLPAEVAARLAALWSWRLGVAEAEAGKGEPSGDIRVELEAFGLWVASGVFEMRWALGMLARILRRVGRTNNDRLVVSYLAECADSAPEEVLACLDAYDIHGGGAEPWRVHLWREEARAALRTLRASTAPSLRDAAGALVNRWVAYGYVDFRELLDD